MPKLQVALDTVDFKDALTLIETIAPVIDIVEAGTPFVLKYGLKAVRLLKEKFPALEVLCDGKIVDAGAYEAGAMFSMGADWVTVMAFTDRSTIHDCVRAAQQAGGKVMADMLCVTDMAARVKMLEDAGVDCIAVHVGVDQQRLGHTPLEDLLKVKQYVTKSLVAVAGGISADTAQKYLALNPDILIIGEGIVGSPDPAAAAAAIREKIVVHNKHCH